MGYEGSSCKINGNHEVQMCGLLSHLEAWRSWQRSEHATLQDCAFGRRWQLVGAHADQQLLNLSFCVGSFPRGSKYPISEVSDSQNLNGIWNQRPQILGTWTLWFLYMALQCWASCPKVALNEALGSQSEGQRPRIRRALQHPNPI